VYVQTNDAEANEVVAFARGKDGGLTGAGSYATGGRGNGDPHLPSQGRGKGLTGEPLFPRANGPCGTTSELRRPWRLVELLKRRAA
jgi:hypothetical protein